MKILSSISLVDEVVVKETKDLMEAKEKIFQEVKKLYGSINSDDVMLESINNKKSNIKSNIIKTNTLKEKLQGLEKKLTNENEILDSKLKESKESLVLFLESGLSE